MSMPLQSPLRRLRARPLAGLVILGLALAACTTAGGTPAASEAAASSGATASASVASSEPSPTVSAKPSPSPKITQTDTAWGRIWDAVPASFPVPAGGSPVTPDIAASGAWSVPGGDPAAITETLKSGLEAIGLTTAGVDGPLEDGSRIIDSVGKPEACHVQTRIKPTGTAVTVTVLFGAACPFR